jgi:hypothetical protein
MGEPAVIGGIDCAVALVREGRASATVRTGE